MAADHLQFKPKIWAKALRESAFASLHCEIQRETKSWNTRKVFTSRAAFRLIVRPKFRVLTGPNVSNRREFVCWELRFDCRCLRTSESEALRAEFPEHRLSVFINTIHWILIQSLLIHMLEISKKRIIRVPMSRHSFWFNGRSNEETQ